MNKTHAIEVFEKTVLQNAQNLAFPAISTDNGLLFNQGQFLDGEALKALLAQTDNKALIIVSKLQNVGPVIVAFDIADASERRSYSIVSVKAEYWSGFVAKPIPNRSFRDMMKVPYHCPGLFSILGPEGVGKTTLCEGIARAFNGYPLNFVQFHHANAWKSGEAKKAALAQTELPKTSPYNLVSKVDNAPSSRSAFYNFARGMWRTLIPEFLKQELVSLPGEYLYMKNVLRLLTDAHDHNQVAIVDRYSYDRLVRWRNLKKPLLQRFGSYMTCKYMRCPVQAYVLRDDSDRIYARKQAMPLQEIPLHQEQLLKVVHQFTPNYEIIDVSKLDGAEGVRKVVVRKIIMTLGDRVFSLLDPKHRLKGSD